MSCKLPFYLRGEIVFLTAVSPHTQFVIQNDLYIINPNGNYIYIFLLRFISRVLFVSASIPPIKGICARYSLCSSCCQCTRRFPWERAISILIKSRSSTNGIYTVEIYFTASIIKMTATRHIPKNSTKILALFSIILSTT